MSSHRSCYVVALAALAVSWSACAGTAVSSVADAVQAGLQATGGAKVSVASHYRHSKQWPDNNQSAGFNGSSNGTSSVNIGHDGHAIVAFKKPEKIAGKKIVLVPADGGNGLVTWTCKGEGIPTAALPQVCQQVTLPGVSGCGPRPNPTHVAAAPSLVGPVPQSLTPP